MTRTQPFEVEQWMEHYDSTPGVFNIAETCAASISLTELRNLSTDKHASPLDESTKLTYGAIRGSPVLRERIAALYGSPEEDGGAKGDQRSSGNENMPTSLSAQDVVVTQGAISANFLVFYALVGPGDHVVCVYPTYQQLYSVPESLGADVSLWRLKAEDGYVPDVKDLERLVRPNTKMIIINNPNNPTGVGIPGSVVSNIVSFARERDLILLSDEVYRPMFHNLFDKGADIPPPASAMGYEKTIITGSMSKAFALAGIRVGWVASKSAAIIKAISSARDYTTISVSQLDDQIARYALSESVLPHLVARNVALAKTNKALLKTFVEKNAKVCSWVCPDAGTTAFIQFRRNDVPVDDVQFCVDVIEKTKVYFVPGSKCFGGGEDFGGFVRIGYVCHTDVLTSALERLQKYVEDKTEVHQPFV